MQFPELTTQRFLLRRILQQDQEKVFEGLSHPDIIRHYGVSYKTFADTSEQMAFYDNLLTTGTGIWWAICDPSHPALLLGACGFNDYNKFHRHIELGYWLLPACQGKGIMQECLPGIITYAFEQMEVHRIVAVVETGNQSSTRLLEKLGFILEGTHRDCEIKNGRFISLHYYALLSDQAGSASINS